MKIDDQMYDEIFSEEDSIDKIKLNKSGLVATIFDWVGSLISALVVVLLLMTFLFRVIDVDGTSMESTLIDTDKVVITNLFYTPENGDVIVISHGEEYEKPLVKRVIATPGQTLKIDFEKEEVYVDGVLLDEPYIQGNTIRGNAEIPEVIPEGKVFVMGDNRTVSLDSRYHEIGLIDVKDIIGKAQLVVIPHKYADTGNGTAPQFDISGIRYIYAD